jgi:hypothetical protein
LGEVTGSGDGDGYGSGDGYGDGSGYGYGSGSGDGSGYGYGDGSGIVKCSPSPACVTGAHLEKVGACDDQVRLFRRTFPDGANWPDDITRAHAAGLDIKWARQNLGLLLPCGGE